MLIKRNGATKEAIHGNCHVAYQTDDCCGPHDGMVALADDWYSDSSPDHGLMLCVEDKQTLSARMLGRLDRPGTESSWLYEASAAWASVGWVQYNCDSSDARDDRIREVSAGGVRMVEDAGEFGMRERR